jgi:hypothetical protein
MGVAALQTNGVYASVDAGYVYLSVGMATSILNCAAGAFKWSGYTSVTPGGCVPCPLKASTSNQVSEAFSGSPLGSSIAS